MQFNNDILPNGITINSLFPYRGEGSFAVFQVINAGSNASFTRTDNGVAQTGTAFVHRDLNTGAITAGSFPLLDTTADAPSPFYPIPADAPTAPLGEVRPTGPNTVIVVPNNTASMSYYFTDYIMYKPGPNGIWVPEGTFAWQVNSSAQYTPATRPPWTITQGKSGITTTEHVDRTAWPPATGGVAGYYTDIQWK